MILQIDANIFEWWRDSDDTYVREAVVSYTMRSYPEHRAPILWEWCSWAEDVTQ